MAGEIQLNGTSFASESSGTITVNNGTIGSSVVFPAGKVLNIQFLSQNSGSSAHTITTNNTFTNINNGTNSDALEFSFTTTSETTKIYTQIGLSAGANSNSHIYGLRSIISKDSFSTTVTSTATEATYINFISVTNFYNRQNVLALFNVDSSSTYKLRVQGRCSSNLGSLVIPGGANFDLLVLEYK
jgi:hypothetical protein